MTINERLGEVEVFGFCAAGTRDYLKNLEYTVDNRAAKPYEITFSTNGMPIMAVPIRRDDREYIGYITPFRGYRYQVSKTIDGECDLGASEVITSMFRFAHMGETGAIALEAFAHVACLKAGVEGMLTHYTEYSAFICLSVHYLREHTDRLKACYGIA